MTRAARLIALACVLGGGFLANAGVPAASADPAAPMYDLSGVWKQTADFCISHPDWDFTMDSNTGAFFATTSDTGGSEGFSIGNGLEQGDTVTFTEMYNGAPTIDTFGGTLQPNGNFGALTIEAALSSGAGFNCVYDAEQILPASPVILHGGNSGTPPPAITTPIPVVSPPSGGGTGSGTGTGGSGAAAIPGSSFLTFKGGPWGVAKGKVAVPISCAAGGPDCDDSLALSAAVAGHPKPRKLGSTSVQLPAGQQETVSIKLSRAGLSLLQGSPGHKLAANLTVVADGKTTRKRVTLKA